MNNSKLEKIIQYGFSDEEKIVYKLGLNYEEISLKFNHSKRIYYPKGKDPRKSYLFKIMYALYQKYKGILKLEEYKYFILAQCILINNIKLEGKSLQYDVKSLFLGEKSLKRYCKFKKLMLVQKSLIKVSDGTTMKEKLLDIRQVLSHKIKPLNLSNFIEYYNSGSLETLVKKQLIRSEVLSFPCISKNNDPNFNKAYEEVFNKILV